MFVGPDKWDKSYHLEHNLRDSVQSAPTTPLLQAMNIRSQKPGVTQIQTVQLRNNKNQPFVRTDMPSTNYTSPEKWYELPPSLSTHAFEHVRSLPLNISYVLWDQRVLHYQDVAWLSHYLVSELHAMLCSAVSLAELDLPGDHEDDVPVHILGRLGELSLPSLTTLRINSMSTTEEELHQFLASVSASLRSLEICEASLVEEGKWENLIRSFPSMLHLDRVVLLNLSDHQSSMEGPLSHFQQGLDAKEVSQRDDVGLAHSRAMTAWILHGTAFHGDMPPVDVHAFEGRCTPSDLLIEDGFKGNWSRKRSRKQDSGDDESEDDESEYDESGWGRLRDA